MPSSPSAAATAPSGLSRYVSLFEGIRPYQREWRRHRSDASGLFATAASMFLVILAQSPATSRAYAVKYQERYFDGVDAARVAFHAAP
jgi:hypothetical protein